MKSSTVVWTFRLFAGFLAAAGLVTIFGVEYYSAESINEGMEDWLRKHRVVAASLR